MQLLTKWRRVRKHCSTHFVSPQRCACWTLAVIFPLFAALTSNMSWPCLLLTFITGEMRRTCFATGSNKIIFKGAVRDHLLMSEIPRVTNTDTLACPATWRPGKESQQSTVFLQNLPTCADMLMQPARLSKQRSEKLRLQHRQRECAFTFYSGHQDCSDCQPKSAFFGIQCVSGLLLRKSGQRNTQNHVSFRGGLICDSGFYRCTSVRPSDHSRQI